MNLLDHRVPMLVLLVALAVVVSLLSSLQTVAANGDDDDDDFSDLDLEQHGQQEGDEDDDDDDDNKSSGTRHDVRSYGRLGEAYERTCGSSPIMDSLVPDGLPRIFNAANTAYGQFPSYVRLRLGVFNAECGGVLISDRHVLSAHHCMSHLTGREALVAILGDNSRALVDAHELSIKGRKLCSSPRYVYEKDRGLHDWVVVELSKPVRFNDYVQPACLPRWPPTPTVRGSQAKCFFLGMGANKFTHKNFTDVDKADPVLADSLQNLRVEQQTCQSGFNIPENDESRVCYGRGDKRTGPLGCYGDSGGPILCTNDKNRWTVVGISSMCRAWCGAQPVVRYTHIQSVFANIIKLLPQLDDACKLPLPSYKPRTPPPHVRPHDEIRSALSS